VRSSIDRVPQACPWLKVQAAICFASEVEVRLLEQTAYRTEYHIVRITNTNAIIRVSPRGAKKIPSLCSEQAVRSR
jgi:hypothetical protein